ncbi:nuclear cap-binding protein subunit 1-like [Oscarella lobularis]|uniref:nuclear cap-binding protein subunit 1-like n=1 Tax=Oscarella lobularis TaxID=121494 RepID=UPI00331391F5
MSRRRRSDDGGGGDRYHSSSKRKRYMDDADAGEDSLQSSIFRIYDKSGVSVESNLEEAASTLGADLVNRRTQILEILCQTPTCLPDKTTIYTTLVGLLNVKSYNFGASLVEKLLACLTKSLDECRFTDARHLFRFLADLVNSNVIIPASVTLLMESFLSVLSEADTPQVRTDWYAYTVMSTIPWVAEVLAEKRKPEFERILDKLQKYVSQRKNDHVAGLRVWTATSDLEQKYSQDDYINVLWNQIQNMKNDGWKLRFSLKPYRSFSHVLCEALQQALPQVRPPPHVHGTVYPAPRLVFRLFEDSDVHRGVEDRILPSPTSIDRFIVNEMISNVIDVRHRDRKDCARALVSIPGKSKLPLTYILVEAALGDLFQLPSPPHLPVMYGSLLVELSRLNPSKMPVVLVQAVSLLFERLDVMNTVCINRFAIWFSFHLSNVQFRWEWEDWQEHLSLPSDHPKRKFISDVLEMCIRFSYRERIGELLPDSFTSILPPESTARCKYNKQVKPDLPGSDVAQRFLTSVRDKVSLDQLRNVLSELPNEPPSSTPTEGACFMPVSLRLEVFLQTICNVASKSFSHMFLALTKFKSLFLELMELESSQIEGLAILTQIWSANSQMLTVLIDKMQRLKIIKTSAIVKWIFHPEMVKFFNRRFIWEILNSALAKIVTQPLQISNDLKEIEKRSQENKMETDGTGADDEQVAALTDELEKAQNQQKEAFLTVVQLFVKVLGDYLASCDKDSARFDTLWFKCTRDQLRQIMCHHISVIVNYRDALESLIFTPETDQRIMAVYYDFQGLIS